MKKIAIAALLLCSVVGCRKGQPASVAEPVSTPSADAPHLTSAPVASTASELHPAAKGIPYQLTLQSSAFSFCDDAGPQTVDLASGKQAAGTQTCDRKNEQIQSRCDDNAITSPADGPADTIDLGKNTYRLSGHARDCDQEGNIAIVSTGSGVEVIDFAANKVAIIDTPAPDKVVIGSGWVAWNGQGSSTLLKLETIAKAMQHASTPKS